MIQIDTGLLELLPEYYKDISDYQAILSAEETELEQIALFINAVHDNFFVQTMDESTAAAWERLLGITAESGQTLAFRQARVLNRISTRPPFTMEFLSERLDELIGVGKWTIDMDYANYTLYIESSAESQDYAVEVAHTVNQIKPAHIVYINRPYLAEDLLINEAVSGGGIQFNYRLGTWQLGVKAFVTGGEEVIYKMASTASINANLINYTAEQISSKVNKARINNSTSITSLTKSRTAGVLTITYTVPNTVGSAITKIELLDSSNNVLTSSTVYIPVSSAIEMKHKITTQEGV